MLPSVFGLDTSGESLSMKLSSLLVARGGEDFPLKVIG